MDAMDNRLEERLARMEGGEPLEASLFDLPEDEALLVKKAAILNTIAESAPVPVGLSAQRRNLLRLAKENRMKPTRSQSVFGRTRPRWVFPVVLTGGVALGATVFTCIAVFSLLAALLRLGWPDSFRSIAFKISNDPHSAVIQEMRGLVEVQDDSGEWTAAEVGLVVEAGQSIRTGKLSSVALGFYDGSRTQLGPEAEVAIDELDAQKSGPRVIVLTQRLGESQHDVVSSSDPASRYEVHTPSGVGVAKGTSFRVVVTIALFVRFTVDEGAVAVTNLNTTVIVVAGQTTVIVAGQAPAQPVFRIRGEGIVEKTGSTWHIAGHTFRTESNTVFVGDPQVGDVVAFEARIVRDGSPILGTVVLLSEAPENRFSFTGEVELMGDAWTVSGKTVQVNDQTDIEEGIEVGDIVEVKGKILEDGKLLATDIRFIEDEEDDLLFNFVGVIDAISTDEWTISGITVIVNENTHIEEGLVIGDVVRVRGRIKDGDWLAKSIVSAEEDDREFTIIGTVESLDPWKVGGIEFETDDRTRIDDGIEVGDTVKVEGRILEDGKWVAASIELLEDAEPRWFNFVGIVDSMDPWKVGGIEFTTDGSTTIDSGIMLGDEVRVKGVILPNGVWLAKSIELLEEGDDLGCVSFSTVVRQVGVNQIVLQDWQVVQLNNSVQVQGQISVATVIIVSGCTPANGSFIITHIIVVYQLDALPIIIKPPQPDGGGSGDDDDDDDEDDDDDD